ncbi:MAG: histidine kinase [Anaerococcus sp.]|nr:histidine kinase [Anaerococcus sp.]
MIYSKKIYKNIIIKVIMIFFILIGLFLTVNFYIYFYLDGRQSSENVNNISKEFNYLLNIFDDNINDNNDLYSNNFVGETNNLELAGNYYKIKQKTGLNFQMILLNDDGKLRSFGYRVFEDNYLKTFSKIINCKEDRTYTTSIFFKNKSYIVKSKSYNGGKLYFYIPTTSIEDKLSEVGQSYFICDRYGKIIINDIPYINQNMNSIYKISDQILENKNYIHSKKESYPFTINSFKPRNISLVSLKISLIFISLLSLSLVITLILVVRRSVDQSTKIIGELNKEIKQVSNGESSYIRLRTNDEIEYIIDNINELIKSKKLLLDNNLKLKYMNKYNEIKMLESQFNPHFLYNTLELISIMMYLDPKSADRIMKDLTQILRYSINNLSFVRLDEDIEYIYKFLEIEKIKYEDKLNTQIFIDEASREVLLPKLFLQPLVENAIKYAYKDKGEVILSIDIKTVGKELICNIFDNGNGLSKEEIEKLNKNIIVDSSEDYLSMDHHGLSNSFNRLKLLYKNKVDMRFIEVEDGVLLRIKIDLR